MNRFLLVPALVAVVFIARTPADVAAYAARAAQDTQTAQDTLTAQDEIPPLPPLVQLAADLAAIAVRIEEVETYLAAAPPESQGVFTFQRRTRWSEHHEVLGRLVEGIEREQGTVQEDSPVIADADSLVADADSLIADADSLVIAEARSALQRELVTIEAWLADVSTEEATIRQAAMVDPPTDFVQTEIELSRLRTDIDELYLAFAENYERAPVLGLDLSAEQSVHQAALLERTGLLGASLEQALEERAEYEDWITKPGVDTLTMGLRIAATEERVLGVTASLQAMVELMAASDLEVSDYRRLIVTATGDIGIADVLDVQVVGGLINQWSQSIFAWFRSNIDAIILRLVIIGVILFLASGLSRLTRRIGKAFLGSKRVDVSKVVRNLAISGLANMVWIVAFFVTLSLVGLDLGPMLAGLGIAGFVIGFALQDTLSNFASGLMIMMYRPFDVGDWVTVGGVNGEVKDLTLVSTVIRTDDNRRITVPNGKVWGDVINNASAETTRRIHLFFKISHTSDVDQALHAMRDVLAKEERVLEDPEPLVKVSGISEFSVELLCYPWCKTEDYWGLYWDLNRLVKNRFDAEGVSFPFPQTGPSHYPVGVGPQAGPAVERGED